MDKQPLRRQARKARGLLDDATWQALSGRIHTNIESWPPFARAKTIMAYASAGSEVVTWPLLQMILDKRIRLALPYCLENGMMCAKHVVQLDALVPRTLGIWEPAESAADVPKAEIDIILVPGLLFDVAGNRLGQGGGYYDRFLQGFEGTACALAFSVQVVPDIPAQPHDRPVDAIATENGILITGRGKGYGKNQHA